MADRYTLSAPAGCTRILTATADARRPDTGWTAFVHIENASGLRVIPAHFACGQWRSESFQLPEAGSCSLRVILRRGAERCEAFAAVVALT